MAYDTVTLATVLYNRVKLTDDAAVLNSANSTFEVPDTLQLKRVFPKPTSAQPVIRGSIKVTYSWKDSVTGKVYPVILECTSSVPVQVPAASVQTALDRLQAAIANEAMATDVLQKGIVY